MLQPDVLEAIVKGVTRIETDLINQGLSQIETAPPKQPEKTPAIAAATDVDAGSRKAAVTTADSTADPHATAGPDADAVAEKTEEALAAPKARYYHAIVPGHSSMTRYGAWE